MAMTDPETKRLRKLTAGELADEAVSAAFAALPLATAKAQYYPPCSPFPLFWPMRLVPQAGCTASDR
jgi:hypothetical protein